MKKVFVTEAIHPEAMAILEKSVQVIRARGASPEAFLEALSEAEGVILRKSRITAQQMKHAPRLRIIARHGVGFDTVDIKEATRRGIIVTNTPGANTESVAEVAIGFMISCLRRFNRAQGILRSHSQGSLSLAEIVADQNLTGMDLEGKVLGIIGTGRIGSAVARKCRAAFDMKVLGYDPYVEADKMAVWGVQKVESFKELFPAIDILTIHCPLTEETRGMVGREELRMMKPGAYVINTARGGILDEAALYEALRSGHIAGAALDVWEKEPPDFSHPLLGLENVMATPHIAGTAEESLRRMAITAVEELLTALRGERPRFVANPEIWRQEKAGRD